jgi:hypothetical protein
MGSPPNKGRGLRGSQSSRSKPQRTWDSFLLAPSVLEASTGGTGFHSYRVSVPLAEVGVERSTPEGGMLETAPPQEKHHGEEGGLGKTWEKGRKTTPKLS